MRPMGLNQVITNAALESTMQIHKSTNKVQIYKYYNL